MKRAIKIIIFLLLAFYTNAQQKEGISIGQKETIYSEVLGESRVLWIYTPGVTSEYPDAASKYPVLFVLDGGAHFYSTTGIVQQLSQANGNGVLPGMIIVGIESTNRLKDFTPTADGPNSFVKFLSDELIPFIEKKYNAAPYKLLVGHSLGGLLTVDILSNFPNMFDAYIAIEPSMGYGDEQFLNRNMTAIARQEFTNTRFFMGIANTLPVGMSLSKVKNDKTDETKHIRAIARFDDFLKNSKIKGLKYRQKYYENETHNSVPLISEYDGLRFIFDYYPMNATESDFTDGSPALVSGIQSHYQKISEEMGYKVSPPEAVIQYFGYDALAKKHDARAEALFKLNIDNYPESSKAYDAYADYFAAKKDTVNAVKYYKMALLKNTDQNIQSKLNSLINPGSLNITGSDLQKYAAVYTVLPYYIDIEIYIKENKLWSRVPGEADEELVPVSQNVFTLKNKQGYTITFNVDGGKITGFSSVQPDGTFKGVLKK